MSTEDRIVGMKFDNTSFEKGASTTLLTLQKLKDSMNFSNAGSVASRGLGVIQSALSKFGVSNPFAKSTQGVAELQTATSRFSFGTLEGGITNISSKFLAMSTVAITALANITNRAVDAGLSFAKSFTFQPIMDGLAEYELNLKSIQTVQANTDQPLPKINNALAELNRYSDQTIYNFSEMARNVGTFTAAGVDLETSVSSIKGIANLAALSGSSSQQAATAMYQLSQAISSGRVGLQDWNSVVNAGMGGKKLQNALAQTAIAMGDIDKTAVKMVGPMKKLEINGGSFRESIMAKPGETPWLSSDILVNTLAAMDGRFSRAALSQEKLKDGTLKYKNAAQVTKAIEDARNESAKKGIKYTDEQFKALQQMSTMAFKSATEVKTLGQVFDIAKETIGSGWSASFQSIFGNLKESKKLFTGMSTGLNSLIEANALARNNLLAGWKDDGGRTKMITGLRNAWKALLAIAKPIKNAFRAIFPKTTSDDLVALSDSFKNFTKGLIIGEDTAKNLKRTFKGVFAIFSIAAQIVKAAVGAFFDLIGVVSSGSGGFLEFTAGIGIFLQKLDKALKEGDSLKSFFQTLADVLKIPLAAILGIGDALGNMFGKGDSKGADKVTGAIDKVTASLTPLEGFAQKVRDSLGGVGDIFSNMGEAIGKGLGSLGPALAKGFNGDTFGRVLDTINVALTGGIVYMLRNFLNKGIGNIDFGGGVLSSLGDALESVTDTMAIMQTNIKANIILKIAGALGIMAASIALIAFIPPAKLAQALATLAAGFLGMQGALVSLSAAVGVIGMAKLPIIASSMVLLATALAIFAGAVALMGSIPFDYIVRGLFGIGGMLFILKKFFDGLDNKGIIRSAGALLLLSVSLNLMAGAMKIFATMSWEEMGKGLAGFAGSLTAIAGTMRLMPKDMVLQATALAILSGALIGMAVALKLFATISWEEMARGLSAVAGMLVIIGGAMRLMPANTMILQSVALNLIAAALLAMSVALKSFGDMSWEEIGTGLVALGGALAILAVALNLMNGTLMGSAALVVATGALMFLTPILITLGSLSWETIIKGLAALAGLFTVLGVAGLLLAPIVPAIMGLGAAILFLGLGLAAMGAAALAFSTAFGIIVGLGMAGVTILADLIGTFIASIPGFIGALGVGLGQFAKELTKYGPDFTRAMDVIISSMLTSINKNIPKFGRMLLTMLDTGLRVITTAFPKITNAGIQLIISFLSGVEKNIGKITDKAAKIAINFMDALAKKADKIIQSGVNLVLSVIEGIAKALGDPNNQDRLIDAGADIGKAIIDGAVKGLSAGKDIIVQAAQDVGGWALKAIKKVLGIASPSKEFKKIGQFVVQGFIEGIVGGEQNVTDTMATLGENIKNSVDTSKTAITDLTTKLKDLQKAKREAEKDKNPKNDDKYDKQIKKAKEQLAQAEEDKKNAAKIRALLKGDLADEQVALKALGKQYDQLSEDLKNAEDKLKEVTQYRDQIASKFNVTPDIEKNTSLESYMRNADKEKKKVEQFNADLEALRAMGLDDTSYQKLLDEGLDAQPFITKLLAAGPDMVAQFNSVNVGLNNAAVAMGENAAKQYFGVGVQAQQGLVNGIKSQIAVVESQMTAIAQIMVDAIKKALKIKSPSRAFMEVGKYSNEGLVKGLKTYSSSVNKAAYNVGTGALESLQESMKKSGSNMFSDLSMDPTITPVLDLTNLQKEASKIQGLMPGTGIVGQVSFDQASSVSSDVEASTQQSAESSASSPVKDVTFVQNLNSPKPVNAGEAYRGSKSIISMALEELRK